MSDRFHLPDRATRATALGIAAFAALTSVDAPAGWYLTAQHAPTVLAVGFLWWLAGRRRVDRASLGLFAAFWGLHCVGARWIYSYVPYDAALRAAFGADTGDWFGWTRNHYDRLVHFAYGVCFAWPAARLHRRWGRGRWAAAALAVEFVLATSGAYELAEWGAAVVMAPDWADSYLGQQGDAWDAQKDMALAGLGAVLVIVAGSLRDPASDGGRLRKPN